MNIEIESTAKGAELKSLKVNDTEKLHNGKTFWNRQAPVLFPIIGSLKDDKTEINDKTYQMSQHGFARDMIFDCIYKDNKIHSYVLVSNEETLLKYPFLFELKVDYIVNDNDLTIKYTVLNKDDKKIYFGIGGHPAFKCDYINNKVEIEFEKEEKNIEFYRLNGKLLDIKESNNLLQDNKRLIITNNLFDLDAVIMTKLSSNKVTLKENNEKILSFEFDKFPYFALWSKKDAPFICLEPWFTTADKVSTNGKLNDKEGIIYLNPEEIFTCSYKIIF